MQDDGAGRTHPRLVRLLEAPPGQDKPKSGLTWLISRQGMFHGSCSVSEPVIRAAPASPRARPRPGRDDTLADPQRLLPEKLWAGAGAAWVSVEEGVSSG